MIDRKKMRFSISTQIKETDKIISDEIVSYDDICEKLLLQIPISGIDMAIARMGTCASLQMGESFKDPFVEVTVKRIA